MAELLPIFVYGTLQLGRERHQAWPREPLKIEPATTAGRLYDLGAYPGLVEGQNSIQGELWHVRAEDLAVTLERLDEIEGYSQGGLDLFVRRIVDCLTLKGEVVRAYTYYFNQLSAFPGARIVNPDSNGLSKWQRAGTSS